METNQIENVLKQVYLEVLRNQLNNSSPFFTKVKRSSSSVYGNKIVLVKSCGPDNYKTYISELATNLYSIRISDKVVRAYSNGNSSVLVNLLNDQCEGVLKVAKRDLTRQLLSDGSGDITKIINTTEDGELVVEDCYKLYIGQYIKIRNKEGDTYITERIVNINYATSTIRTSTKFENNLKDYIIYSPNADLLGLKYLFSDNKYMEVERRNYIDKPQYSKCKISELYSKISELSDELGTNLVLCSPEVKRELTQYLVEHNQNCETVKVGEYTALSINGVPLCALGEMRGQDKDKIYALNTEEFEWQELCDWLWLDEDGKILRQVLNEPEYEATLVKHSQIICKDLSRQEEITLIN